MIAKLSKKERHKQLNKKIQENPFYTDDELSEIFSVSVQTIRLDRMELGIPELRERIKTVAEKNYQKVKAIVGSEIVGELIDLELGKKGISIFEPTSDMTFLKTKVIRGHYIYSQAESLAISVIDADVALIGVANIKYKYPVKVGDKLIAKAEVIRQRGNKYFVWVKIKIKNKEVFRGKFILVSIMEDISQKRGDEISENSD
ncbi:transcription factor FapR [Aceticella autotrophica]|jgi:acyl-coenzyme A thioesterase PaaI-like protein|uniref:Transcription factor FapR n=1 Tax=Aceticella autotrophica TaxID=2755338 RepID=A0A975G9J4_9THEO|nr:transcription factor FapR [Aceticella autotrophica]MDI6604676.1 transcription factor FapR [Thermoanaerobacteraceae bacterium]QSZ26650.1 transcription factor FapR [Aceticella autotrophica]